MGNDVYILAVCDISDNFQRYVKTTLKYKEFKDILKTILLYNRYNKSMILSTTNQHIHNIIVNILNKKDTWTSKLDGYLYYNIHFTTPLYNYDTGKKVSVGYLISHL